MTEISTKERYSLLQRVYYNPCFATTTLSHCFAGEIFLNLHLLRRCIYIVFNNSSFELGYEAKSFMAIGPKLYVLGNLGEY